MDATTGKQLRAAIVITVVPVGIAILMQRPDIRQAMAMRAAHYARLFCQGQADFWQSLATASAQAYNKARL